jgi:8-oxo-dGTP diphosphatase
MDGKLRNMTSIFVMKDDRILMLYRQGGKVVNNVWVASAGGHFEMDELNDARACVIRELREELGLEEESLCGLKLRYIALRNTNGEVRQNYYFFAELKDNVSDNLSSNEGRLEWVAKEDVLILEMPYTAKYVLKHYLEIGCHSDVLYGGIADGEKVVFIEMPDF